MACKYMDKSLHDNILAKKKFPPAWADGIFLTILYEKISFTATLKSKK